MPCGLVEREIAHEGLSELRVVEATHEREAAMSEAADALAVLPGGAGVLEEAFGQWTWAQLAIHSKPLGFLDVPVGEEGVGRLNTTEHPEANGYFGPLLAMIDRMVASGFLAPTCRDMLIVERGPDALLAAFGGLRAIGAQSYETASPDRTTVTS